MVEVESFRGDCDAIGQVFEYACQPLPDPRHIGPISMDYHQYPSAWERIPIAGDSMIVPLVGRSEGDGAGESVK